MAPGPTHRPRHVPYIFAGLAALLLWAFGMVADEVIEGDTAAFDTAVTSWFREGANDPWGPLWLEEAMRDVTAMGSFTILGFILIVTVLFLVLAGKGRTALFVTASVIASTVVSTSLKMLFDRPRPDVEAATRVFTASFPSGHATVSAVVYLTLGLLLAESATASGQKVFFVGLGVFMTVAIGISRVYLGVHYPTDVVAGWSLGAGCALVCWVAYSLSFHTSARRNPKQDPRDPS